jgi:hypothetical protein
MSGHRNVATGGSRKGSLRRVARRSLVGRRMAAKKNSLVGNINKRKRAGKSRPKSRSTISSDSYEAMKKGWPKSKKPSEGAGRKTKKKTAKRATKKA